VLRFPVSGSVGAFVVDKLLTNWVPVKWIRHRGRQGGLYALGRWCPTLRAKWLSM